MKRYFFLLPFILFNSLCAQKGGVVKQDMIPLPPPVKTKKSLEECIEKRRSVRSFGAEDLTWEEISTLCWACQGITDSRTGHRAAPSAGATYPLEVYLVKKDGLFRYEPNGHALIKIVAGDLRKSLSQAALGQEAIAEAPVDFVITAIPKRTTQRYGERGMRYIYMEMGHCAQNLHLEAVALGLGSVPIGAFADEAVVKLLSLAQEEIPGYIIPVGNPR
jgi:SagB-type dehydrogenase family enzyme